jgi:hypothetical protein
MSGISAASIGTRLPSRRPLPNFTPKPITCDVSTPASRVELAEEQSPEQARENAYREKGPRALGHRGLSGDSIRSIALTTSLIASPLSLSETWTSLLTSQPHADSRQSARIFVCRLGVSPLRLAAGGTSDCAQCETRPYQT